MKTFFKLSIMALGLSLAVFPVLPQAGFATQETHTAGAVQEQAWLGVRVGPVPAVVAAHVADFSGQVRGVLMVEVLDNSPASKAGLQQYDIVTGVNDREISSPEDFVNTIGKFKPDDEVSLEYYRGGKKFATKVVLGTIPDQTLVREELPSANSRLWQMPFMDWLKTPDGIRQSAEFDRRERERQGNPQKWSSFQSMSVTKSADGTYSARIDYQNGDDQNLSRQYSGSREEIRAAVNEDEELPDDLRQHLLRSLDQQTPELFRFDWPPSLRELFGQDWDDFRR